VFLVNSRFSLVSAAETRQPEKGFTHPGPPSPEVTGVFCRVP